MAANSLKATFPSLQSTKVPQEPILITEKEGEKDRSDLAAQPPHPWGASDGPGKCRLAITALKISD